MSTAAGAASGTDWSIVIAVAALIVSIVAAIAAVVQNGRQNTLQGRLATIEERRHLEERAPIYKAEIEWSPTTRVMLTNETPHSYDGATVTRLDHADNPTAILGFQVGPEPSWSSETTIAAIEAGGQCVLPLVYNDDGTSGELRMLVVTRAGKESWSSVVSCDVSNPRLRVW